MLHRLTFEIKHSYMIQGFSCKYMNNICYKKISNHLLSKHISKTLENVENYLMKTLEKR